MLKERLELIGRDAAVAVVVDPCEHLGGGGGDVDGVEIEQLEEMGLPSQRRAELCLRDLAVAVRINLVEEGL